MQPIVQPQRSKMNFLSLIKVYIAQTFTLDYKNDLSEYQAVLDLRPPRSGTTLSNPALLLDREAHHQVGTVRASALDHR